MQHSNAPGVGLNQAFEEDQHNLDDVARNIEENRTSIQQRMLAMAASQAAPNEAQQILNSLHDFLLSALLQPPLGAGWLCRYRRPTMLCTHKKHGSRQESHPLLARPEIE